MGALAQRLSFPIVLAVVAFAILWIWTDRITVRLENAAIVTGWSLFAIMIFLACFNVRKKLAAFNLGRARLWLAFHIAVGLLAIAVFLLHTGVLWPTGIYEQLMAALFWLVSATGIIGYVILNTYPKRLTDTGLEIVYETVPSELYEIREMVEAEIVACTEGSGESTLAEHYEETLDWYFRRPRFYLSHVLGGDQAKAWIRSDCEAVRRYLGSEEETSLDKIVELAERKAAIDKHFACQDLMRKWLLVHLPFSVSLIVFSIWHVTLIHVYAQ